MKKIISLSLLFFVVLACKKEYPARKIAGVYEGYVYNCEYQSASPSVYIADTVFGEFTVSRNGKYIQILGEKIHKDSLADGKYVTTNGDCSSSYKLYGDTLIAYNCEYYNPYAYKYSGCYGIKVRD